MTDQHLSELFIDGIKVDQWANKDGDEEVIREESKWPTWIDRPMLSQVKGKIPLVICSEDSITGFTPEEDVIHCKSKKDSQYIPNIGSYYPSIWRETVAHVLSIHKQSPSTTIIHFRTYEEETTLTVEEFWKYYKRQ
jgi:hypothetical protein